MGFLQRVGSLLRGRADVDAGLESVQRAVLEKGWRTQLPQGDPAHPMRSLQFDPFALVAAEGRGRKQATLVLLRGPIF